MVNENNKASLHTLPREILRIIIPEPTQGTRSGPAWSPPLEIRNGRFLSIDCHPCISHYSTDEILLEQSDPDWAKWLPIEPRRAHWNRHPTMRPVDLRRLLRSLSQTCRSLRHFALPLLWGVCHVETLEQLGRLRKVLRISPHLGRLVRSFVFAWNMGDLEGECAHDYEHYAKSEGSLLDMAFRNRNKMWEGLARKHGCVIYQESDSEEESDEETNDSETNYPSDSDVKRHCFYYNGHKFDQPGWEPYTLPGHRTLTDMLKPVDGRKFLVSGPDGKGEDRILKNPSQFRECISEVMERMTAIETFGWCTHITPMPARVYNALTRLPNLSHLHVRFSAHRGALCTLPLQNLTSKLKYLSLWGFDPIQVLGAPEPTEEHKDTICDNFPLDDVDDSIVDKCTTHAYTAHRMIIAAAKTGNLRHLRTSSLLRTVFTIRSLLPCWVGMDSWALHHAMQWEEAAVSLRPLLAHASLWLGTTAYTMPRYDRSLTGAEVQQLQAYFEEVGTPQLVEVAEGVPQPVELYLPWLAEDVELAQKVAEAWNGVLQRGGADFIKCRCEPCMSSS